MYAVCLLSILLSFAAVNVCIVITATRMKMMILPIKKKWFEMILSGEKMEEYREIKPYYTKRFQKILAPWLLNEANIGDKLWFEECECGWYEDVPFDVLFRNGYCATSPSFIATVTLCIKTGKVEWGAAPDVKYYTLKIADIYRNKAEQEKESTTRTQVTELVSGP